MLFLQTKFVTKKEINKCMAEIWGYGQDLNQGRLVEEPIQ